MVVEFPSLYHSVQMIFERIFLDHRAKRNSIESKKQWAKNSTFGYTTGKSRECRDAGAAIPGGRGGHVPSTSECGGDAPYKCPPTFCK